MPLDGEWDFALDPTGQWASPGDVTWDRRIRVPFAPETEASGIGDTGFYQRCWYRTRFPAPALADGERLHLHFGAVDYEAIVWADGTPVAAHRGGYTPFRADVTAAARTGTVEIVVRADDDPHDLAKPRGKQDWQLRPHSIWYPRTTGIWQTVWMEPVPATRVSKVRWTPTLDRWEIALDAYVVSEAGGPPVGGLRLRVALSVGAAVLADDTYRDIAGEVQRGIALSDPGIDDYRNELLWSQERPTLIQAHLQLLAPSGHPIDEVWSYTALRSIGMQGDRFVLNGRPLTLRLVLDQGVLAGDGPDPARRRGPAAGRGGHQGDGVQQGPQAPEDREPAVPVLGRRPGPARLGGDAQRVPVHPAIRGAAHGRVGRGDRAGPEPPVRRRLGAVQRVVGRARPARQPQRHYVRALYHLTKTLDPTRPVVGNDVWESVATDVIGIHDYDDRLARIAARYVVSDDLARLFRRERPGGRMLVLGDGPEQRHPDHPVVLTEFGGIASSPEAGTWGYSQASSAEAFAERYARLLAVVRSMPVLAGFCYTQFADTYQEANGLLFADRTPKFSLEEIARATRGPTTLQEYEQEQIWRDELMRRQQAPRTGPT